MEARIDLTYLRHAVRIADDAVAHGPQPGVVIALAGPNDTLWTYTAPGPDHLGLDSIFQIASITKPITATAVMRLVEEGRVALNVPVAHYLPEFAANGKDRITAWHLLTHSSGMEEERLWDDIWTRFANGEQLPETEPFDAACRAELLFEPGTSYRYTTLTYDVLAELITRVSGEPYPQYLRRHIFEPLGMLSTAFYPLEPERAATLHDFGPAVALEQHNALPVAGGGLWSTASDLLAFGRAYLRGGNLDGYRLISPASICLMTHHYTAGQTQFGSGDAFNYGLGWGKPSSPRNGDLLASERAYGHLGASGTMLWIDPEYGFVYVWLSNRWGMSDPSEAASRALNVVYGAFRS